MPGFYGPYCNLCPENFACDGSNIVPCPSAFMNGSSNCVDPSPCPQNNIRSKVPPVSWSVFNSTIYPYANDTCGCARGPIRLTLDFGSPTRLSGMAMQSTDGWITSYFIEIDNNVRVGGLYIWNSLFPLSEHELLFPYGVTTRNVTVIIIDWIGKTTYPKVAMAGLSDPCCLTPPGSNCTFVDGSPVLKPCPNCCQDGTLSYDGGKTCSSCPAGYSCSAAYGITACNVGFFCPAGSAAMIPCL